MVGEVASGVEDFEGYHMAGGQRAVLKQGLKECACLGALAALF